MPRSQTKLLISIAVTALAVLTGGLIVLSSPTSAASRVGQVEAETLKDSSGQMTISTDATASGGKALTMWGNSKITARFNQGVDIIAVMVKGDQCSGPPLMAIAVDGVAQGTALAVKNTDWLSLGFRAKDNGIVGTHTVSVSYINDAKTSACDRNLRVDFIWATEISASTSTVPPKATPTPVPVSATPTVPSIATLYRDPDTQAAAQADALRAAGRTTDAALVDKIASQPTATWIGGYSGDDKALARVLAGAAAENSRALFTIYNIPFRDGGNYSGGGAPDGASYRAWIDHVAATIGGAAATVIIEPDAVAMKIPDPMQSQRWPMLKYAIDTFDALRQTRVYLDAGNGSWRTPEEMATRLRWAGVAEADGFAVNVANFQTTSEEIQYGRAISAGLAAQGIGSKPFVIDTSRNGNGPVINPVDEEDSWCNPVGRALGARPTLNTGVPGVDAYLWIQHPGESNGLCNGGGKAGAWYQARALELARLAKW